MIQIVRFDQLGSGVLNIHKYWPIYSPGAEPVFRETPHGFELILPLPGATAAGQDGEQFSEQVLSILRAAATTPRSKRELLEAAGLADAYLNYKRHILSALEAGLIERTLPEKPNSRLQKYRLTEKGKLAAGR